MTQSKQRLTDINVAVGKLLMMPYQDQTICLDLIDSLYEAWEQSLPEPARPNLGGGRYGCCYLKPSWGKYGGLETQNHP